MASTEDRAYEIMRELDVDYVLVIFGGLTGYSSDGRWKNNLIFIQSIVNEMIIDLQQLVLFSVWTTVDKPKSCSSIPYISCL